MRLQATDEIFSMFPDAVLGVVITHDIDNSGDPPEIAALLRAAEASLQRELAGVQISEHPHIAPWRAAYKQFGAKPKDYPSSIENLARRVLKGYTLPHINTLVDAYNAISLRLIVPVGGEDLAAIRGDVLLTVATEHETPMLLLGEREERAPRPGEVIYKDDLGAICRRWNWKEAERTKLTAATRDAVLVIEGLPPVEQTLIEQAVQELAALVERHCGGSVRTAFVSRSSPSVDLS
jgi:DNA/RNA-binding domain of Phe-tRNA-synthetase-like protein